MLGVCALAACAAAQTAVPTAQYDNARTGANPYETILTPRNVNRAQFGKQFVMPVDGDVYAQPLYVPGLAIPGKGTHDVVFVATEHDTVYAFDAAGSPAEPLWQRSFLAPGVEPMPGNMVSCFFIQPELGVTATPAIDLASKTMYVLARTKEHDLYYQRLHALDIATGAERPGSGVAIRATAKGASLMGLVSHDVPFNAVAENPRAALLLAGGTVYIAWGSSCDAGTYYGWVMAYDGRTLQQKGAFNAAPINGQAGIWQSDAGIAADAEGNVYAVTGNGKFTADSGGRDYGDSVLKLGLGAGGLAVRDYFTPYNQAALNREDLDLGSSGPVLLPDQPGPHKHVLVTEGKDGLIYVIDRDRMGKYRTDSNAHAIQAFHGAATGGYGAPAYWNGHLYSFGRNDVLKDFAVDNGRVAESPAHQGTFRFHEAGATPAVSANGTKDGIVWIFRTKAWNAQDTYGTLQAYEAADVSRLLYTSADNPRDTPGLVTRFAMPTVAGGRVYVGMKRGVWVYGLSGNRVH
jgi:hypothetical protein